MSFLCLNLQKSVCDLPITNIYNCFCSIIIVSHVRRLVAKIDKHCLILRCLQFRFFSFNKLLTSVVKEQESFYQIPTAKGQTKHELQLFLNSRTYNRGLKVILASPFTRPYKIGIIVSLSIYNKFYTRPEVDICNIYFCKCIIRSMSS